LLESNDRRKRVKVYLAIATVAANLAKEGISKARTNQSQGYKFRGIDDVYNSLAPFLAEAKLCIVERVNAKSTALFYVTVRVQFDFVSAEDGSKHSVVTYGEAMDSGDKATNKAMSAAYKYAAMQAFCIPTEGDNDADATTHEVKAVEPDAEGAGYLTGAQSLDELADIWRSLTPKQRATLGPTKDAMKKRLMDAEAATQP
jgi:hypothetical protein